MIKKLLKSIILTGVLITPTTAFASSAPYDNYNGWNFSKDTQVWQYYKDGNLVHNGLIKLDNKLYYLNADGSMATGWINYGDSKLYADNDGSIIQDKWMFIDCKWYYFCHMGIMLTGECNLDGTIYNLASDGHLIS